MASFFKSFGKGILYLFVLPFLLVILAFYGVIGIFCFIFLFFKSIVLFFTGRSLHDDLPEDKKAKAFLNPPPAEEIKIEEEPVKTEETYNVYRPEVDPFSTPAANKDPYAAKTVEEGLFGMEEEPEKEPEVEEETPFVPEPEPEEVKSSLEQFMESEPEEDDSSYAQISTGDSVNNDKYEPRSSSEYSIDADEFETLTEEDGVNISFDK